MPNRLALETSPYLQQHADNPVDWYAWGPEALERAKREDKPILLSVGYSACHWCHVMAHESFEDPRVAALMNRLFVNVKVDREERPDIDQIYQSAHQMLGSRSGGWPLTMFLAPDGAPFFGGTYFPKDARYGLPGFPELCERIAQIWRDKRTDIAAQNEEVLKAFSRMLPQRAAQRSNLSADVLVLGDSFANIYSLASMGWGDSAGFVEQVSLVLRRPIDRIVQNDDGAFAARALLRRDLAAGSDRLAGTRVVVWQFAARELAFGDWQLIELPGAR